MAQQNAELARAFYEAARNGAWQAVLAEPERIAPDVEFDLSSVYPDAPIVRGREEVMRWVESGPWGRSVTMEAEDILEVDDDRVLVLVRVKATGGESGVPVEMRDAHEITVLDGRVTRVKVHPDQERALRELGLK